MITRVADELLAAYAERRTIAPFSARGESFDLSAAYGVQAELVRRRRSAGRVTVGRKIGYANKAMWRALGLGTLVWADMYDDTVQYASDNQAAISLGRMVSPKIEPEIVFKLKTPPGNAPLDAAGILAHVEWLALGFEILDCVYADWKFQPADFVAAYGLHAASIVGEPQPVTADALEQLAEALPTFRVALERNGQRVAEGSGKNVLRSPALSLAELAAALFRDASATPLAAGELVTTGTLTESQPIAPGESWSASVEGLDLAALTLDTRA